MKAWMKLTISVIVGVLVLLGNLLLLKGSYAYDYYITNDMTGVDDFRVFMDCEDVLEVRDITYNPDKHRVQVHLRALNPGDVIISNQVYSNGKLIEVESKRLVVDRFHIVMEDGFTGSLYVPFLRWELLLLCILMMVNVVVVIWKLRKTSHYSYQYISYTGVFLLMTVYAGQWGLRLILTGRQPSLMQFYSDLLSIFSEFAILIFPFMLLLSFFLLISNIVLIRKEGRRLTNTLGILLGFSLVGLTVLGMMMYPLLEHVMDVHSYMGFHISYFIESCVYSILAYLESMMLGTMICTLRAKRLVPSYDKDYMIILGCAIKQDGTVTPLLQGRCDRAISFAKKQEEETGKKLVFIASGGQGSDEVISEAEAIRNYLLSQGIPKERILLENRSTNTMENMRYSYEIIRAQKEDAKISFSTTGYHVFRSGNLAESMNIPVEGVGSKTKWYFYTNALIREFAANLNAEKRKHVKNIVITIFGIAALIALSYYYNIL